MRLRKVITDNLNLNDIKQADEYNIEYQVRVITPIYGGGVTAGEIDTNMPIRATAIKGQLRYWWRFLQKNRKDDKDKKLSGKKLFIKEREIWGGMGEDSKKAKEKDFSSNVFLQITLDSNVKIDECSPSKYAQPNQNNRSALDYALFPVIQNEHQLLNCNNLTFTLKIKANKSTLTDAQWGSVEESIKWWACFGGIGARTRRGLGAVEINQIEAITPEQVSQYHCILKTLPNNPDAINAWNKSIEKLKLFRQGKNIGRNNGSDPKKPKKLGRSFWPEADSIRKLTNKNANGRHPVNHEAVGYFPRAAFGLPIIFDFNSPPNAGEPRETTLKPTISERMASPLILKPMAMGNGKYAPIALLLPNDHLEKLEIKLMEGNNALTNLPAGKWWPLNTAKNLAEKTPPMNNRGKTALEAFMNFFGGQ